MIEFEYPEGATPLHRNEMEGLRLTHITNRKELDRWEQDGILVAEAWAFSQKRERVLYPDFIRLLHRRMFERVWKWAGEFRQSDKNLGVHVWEIAPHLQRLCEDAEFWLKKKSYPADEAAIRFHHRLVSIHPFPNGNGRHARLMTDILLVKVMGSPRFTWGSGNLVSNGDVRQRYLDALRAADDREYGPLLAFVRS